MGNVCAHIWAVSVRKKKQQISSFSFARFRKPATYFLFKRDDMHRCVSSAHGVVPHDKWGMALKFHIPFLHDFIYHRLTWTGLERWIYYSSENRTYMLSRCVALHKIATHQMPCTNAMWLLFLFLFVFFFLFNHNEQKKRNRSFYYYLFDKFYTCIHNDLCGYLASIYALPNVAVSTIEPLFAINGF